MDIKGKRGSRSFDADLLVRLREAKGTGNAVSTKEIKDIVKDTVNDLKDQFSHTRSTSGLTAMKKAIANTLEDAVNDGWIKSASARSEVTDFLAGGAADHGSLEHTSHFVKDMVSDYKRNNPVRRTRNYGS